MKRTLLKYGKRLNLIKKSISQPIPCSFFYINCIPTILYYLCLLTSLFSLCICISSTLLTQGFPPVNPDLNNLTPESRSTRMNSMGSRSDASRPASGSISGTDNVGASTSNSTPGASTGGAPGSGTDGDKPPERIEPSLFKSCVALMTWDMGKICFLQAGIRVEQIYESVVLGYLLSWLATDSPVPGFVEEEFYKGFIYGIGLVLMYVGQNVCNNRSYSVGFHVFCTIRSALNGMIYTKAIKVASVDAANDAGQRTGVSGGPMMGGGGAGAGNSGQIVNLMSVDSEKVGMMFFMGLNVVFIPAQLAVIIYFIYELVGVAIFAGLGVIMIILPLIFFIMLFMGYVNTSSTRRNITMKLDFFLVTTYLISPFLLKATHMRICQLNFSSYNTFLTFCSRTVVSW